MTEILADLMAFMGRGRQCSRTISAFFTSICCPIWDHPYNRSLEWRVDNNEIRSYLSLVGAGDGGGEVVLVEV